MARGTRDLSNLTLRILKYHVRMKICMNSHIFKGQQHKVANSSQACCWHFCFSPHLGEISWFLKMVSHTASHSPSLVAILSSLSKSQQAKVLILTISVFIPHPQHVFILGSESLQIYNTCSITEQLSLFHSKKTNDLQTITSPAQLFLHPQPQVTITEGVLIVCRRSECMHTGE